MRFGKRLAELTQSSPANEPYISYKGLKKTVSKLAALNDRSEGCRDDGDWSGREEESEVEARSSLAAGVLDPASRASCLVSHQQDFFSRTDADVSLVTSYVQNEIAALEAAVGEWQASAVSANILYTPEQLEEISNQLPFQVKNEQLLVEWLQELIEPSVASAQVTKCSLVEKYSAISGSLNKLLQYIEVNLTAIRKIFKKFEKKVPKDQRISCLHEYKAHCGLLGAPAQDLLVAVLQMQRVVYDVVLPRVDQQASSLIVPIAQLGPESMAMIAWLGGPAASAEVCQAGLPARIDVYAKPRTDVGSTASLAHCITANGGLVAAGSQAADKSSVATTSAAGGSIPSGWSAGGFSPAFVKPLTQSSAQAVKGLPTGTAHIEIAEKRQTTFDEARETGKGRRGRGCSRGDGNAGKGRGRKAGGRGYAAASGEGCGPRRGCLGKGRGGSHRGSAVTGCESGDRSGAFESGASGCPNHGAAFGNRELGMVQLDTNWMTTPMAAMMPMNMLWQPQTYMPQEAQAAPTNRTLWV